MDNIVTYRRGDTLNKKYFVDVNSMLVYASSLICFSDCSDEEILSIRSGDHNIEYVGWQPNMLYEFVDEAGNIIFSRSFPNWEH